MFFAPCAVVLLPAYLASFVSRTEGDRASYLMRLYRGLKLSLFIIVGIFVVYSVASLLIVVASHFIKTYMKWIAMGMGGLIVGLGFMMLAGKNVSLNFHLSLNNYKSEEIEAFTFGVAYAIGALGCLFPLFLVVATQAMIAPSVLQGISYIVAYFSGMSLLMIASIIMASFARDFLSNQLRKILPHMEKLTGVILVIAGLYIIYYQTSLL